MRFSTVFEWLSFISSIHMTEIELGLDRVKAVAARLNLLSPSCPVIIVSGTNGKGSTVAGLEAIYLAAGYRVGSFTSPVLFKHNEEVRLNGKQANDEEFCLAFERIESVRGDVSLSPFEFHTLAALLIFKQYSLNVWILEVGLGGRLDAVNIIDADVALVTSIGIDHVKWLGSTREMIAREKAGIFRQNKPVVCGDSDPPASLMACAKQLKAPFFCQGKDFHYQENKCCWDWLYQDTQYKDLPFNSLATQNMSTVLMAIYLLQDRLPITYDAISKGLSQITLPGRIQMINGPVTEIYDVSHNPAAVSFLAKKLNDMLCQGKTYAVFSMLGDKDITGSIKAASDVIDAWYVAALFDKRAASMEMLRSAFHHAEINNTTFLSSIPEAYKLATMHARPGDRVVTFGSFRTVAEVFGQLGRIFHQGHQNLINPYH